MARHCMRLEVEAEFYKKELEARDKALKKERRKAQKFEDLPQTQDKVILDYKIKVKPSMYDGSTDWITYKNQFEKIAKTYNWSDQTKEFMLLTSLEGEALSAVGLHEDPSYEDMCFVLERSFGLGEEETAAAKLEARILRQDESLDHFARDLKKLVKSAKPNDSMMSQSTTATEYFIKGLPDPEVRLQLKDHRIRDVDEAARRAEILIANRESEKRRIGEEKTVPVQSSSMSDEFKKMEEKISQLTADLQKKEGEGQKTCARGFENRRKEEHEDNFKEGGKRGYHQNYGRFRRRGRGHYRGHRGHGHGYGRGPRRFQRNYYRPRTEVTCYRCGMKGHIQMWCPMMQQQFIPQMQTRTRFTPQVPSLNPQAPITPQAPSLNHKLQNSPGHQVHQNFNHLNGRGQVWIRLIQSLPNIKTRLR